MNNRMAPKWNKKMTIALASVGLVGSIGTGVFFAYNETASEKAGHQAEEKVKTASNSNIDRLFKEDKSEKKDNAKKDVLKGILEKEKESNAQFASIIKGEDGSEELSSSEIALDVINTLPTDSGIILNTNQPTQTVTPIPLNVVPMDNPTPTVPIIDDNGAIEEPAYIEPPVIDGGGDDGGDSGGSGDDVIVDPEPSNTTPTIFADNQSIHIGENFNPYNFATASDNEDGDLTASIQVISNNVNPDKEGTYTVTYMVTDSVGKSSESSISIEVVNDAPILHVVDNQLSVGDVFNPMEGVSAYDTEDGDVTSRVDVIGNNVDNQNPGTYEVTYKVTDSFGKSSTETIQVQVVNDKPTIVAKDQELNVGDTFDPLEGVTAADKQDGDLTSNVQVVANDVDTTQAGTYHVTYVVEDSAGGQTEKTVTIHVKEKNTAPEILMDTNTINLHVGDQPDWMVGVTANDEEDGNLTDAIAVDVANVDLTTPGTYKVVYQVTDSGGLTTTKEVPVTVE